VLTIGQFLLGFHVVALFSEPSPTKRFNLGALGCLAGLLTVAAPIVEFLVLWSSGRLTSFGSAYTGLAIAQLAVGAAVSVLYILLPRRPDVFRDGKPVDRQFTVPLLSRLTFAWTDHLLKYAVANRGLDIDDLHVIDNATRSVNLRANLESIKGSRPLWKSLFITHWKTLAIQHSLTVVQACMAFAPQVALLGILQSLEDRENGEELEWKTWTWVVLLGLLMMFASTVEAWLFWFVWSKIAIPIQEQLSATVFAKSMRRKDIKGTKKKDENDDPASPLENPQVHQSGEAETEEDDDADLQKTRQSIINLVAVDAKRISEAAAWNYLLPSALLKIGIACAFLVKLLGWRATLAGMAIAVVVLPVNIYVANKYSNAQTELMKYRDQKMAVLNEVLQGIRQIKFSALEASWQKKVSDVRNTELAAQWTAFMYDIGLITIWILGPIMLSAVSLAVYATINGGLSASVAFTSISIFGSLEMSLAVLPELISDFVEAYISMGRIDKHLEAPEKTQVTIPFDRLAFEDAAVAWPADDQTPLEERYVLRNISLQLPEKGLTVISGKTGSGKSLLLASILGEADILSGAIKVPQPPPLDERFDEQATSANWLIDSAIAYVAQTPWIENASIKDNVLFGLPSDDARYNKVIDACALRKDLDMLPDGELTDIGANGINLSGGQKWRVSFARALYSRAGILIMDDIFSAVDAHTGRHLYEQALTGEMGQNRTRILVTHHVALCLPRTDYAVFLEDGTVRHFGTIEDLRKSDSLSSILLKEHEIDERASEATAVDDEELSSEEGATLQKILTNRSRKDSVIDNNDEVVKQKAPKKFIEDEKRETGSIRLAIYGKYFKTGGGVLFWSWLILVYLSYMVILIGRVSILGGLERTVRPLLTYYYIVLVGQYLDGLCECRVSSK
jgi:ABC-type multidrug transport system fused ATPase/permease subunit